MAETLDAESGAGNARDQARAALLDAALPHVVFDGWTERTFRAAIEESGVAPDLARLIFARGGVDMAIAFHHDGDAKLAEEIARTELSGMRFRDKVAFAVMRRLELVAGHREEVRRAASLFALPVYAGDGAKVIWHTSDTIWNALGDTSADYNWYTKRTTLSGVISSAVLYWLGDETPDHAATREFVGRRIDNVMQFEKVRANLRKNPVAQSLLTVPRRILDRVRAPEHTVRPDLPGYIGPES